MHVYLVGLPGSGKSYAAPLLAKRLGWPWLDMDELIEHELGETITSCVEQKGEAHFRSVESAVLQKISCFMVPHVIACGGGTTLDELNRKIIMETGISVWLDSPAGIIAERLLMDAGSRPLLKRWASISAERVIQLREERKEAYAFATCRGSSLEEIQDRAVELALASM